MNTTGIIIGLATFLIIGLFHPVVVKAEYYTGTRLWWLFLLAGLGSIGAAALAPVGVLAGALLSVLGFSCLWSILELFEQHKRVEKGWFPKGPGHRTKGGAKK